MIRASNEWRVMDPYDTKSGETNATGGEPRPGASVVIRRALPADGATLLHLIERLAEYERLAPPDAGARTRLLRDMFSEPPRIEPYLALLEGAPVGYALVFETYSSFLALPTLYLEDIFILPEHRREGIGVRFFRTLVSEAHRRGCGRMEWTVLDWNRPAIDFYEKMGARQMSEWKTYRLVRADMERILG
jgi:GNAT superfamily N-acetyltransferase